LTSLLTGHEFPSVERAVWSTRVLEEAIKGLCGGLKIVESVGTAEGPDDSQRRTPEPNAERLLAPPETPRPRLSDKRRDMEDVSASGFAEAVASAETYESYIYGSVAVRNADETRKGSVDAGEGDGKPAVTVLTARRKKRGQP